MVKVVLGMTIALDGFINDRNGSVAPYILTWLFGERPSRGTNLYKIQVQ